MRESFVMIPARIISSYISTPSRQHGQRRDRRTLCRTLGYISNESHNPPLAFTDLTIAL